MKKKKKKKKKEEEEGVCNFKILKYLFVTKIFLKKKEKRRRCV